MLARNFSVLHILQIEIILNFVELTICQTIMKRLLILVALCLCATNLYGQDRVYCEIVERNPTSKKVKITIDFGQKREKNKRAQTLVDDNGELAIFNSKIDALNHLDSLGWRFMQAYTVVRGSSSRSGGSTSSEIHWLLYKEIVEGEDPYKGLTTKELYNK